MRTFLLLALLAAGCSACPDCGDCGTCSSCCAQEKVGAGGKPAAAAKEEAKILFDGKSLANWKATEYGGQGEVEVKEGTILVNQGAALSGVTWKGAELPKTNYEFSVEALKVDGDDIFCGVCFPVGDLHCSFVCGGWGGQVVGLSSVDGEAAADNETCKVQEFKKNQWYKIRVRVTPQKIETWVDDKQMVNLELKDKKISLHPAMELATPFGIATYTTTSKFRNVTLKTVK
jgi:3-keto-disaccharide hydrolase